MSLGQSKSDEPDECLLSVRTNDLLSALAGLLILVSLGDLSVHAQKADRSALTGVVILPRDESAPATVLLLRAEQKPDLETPGSVRYPYLPKRTQTDSHGHFKFESLDPAWLYHFVIIAPGCRPESFDRIDPISEPLTAQLQAVDPRSPPPNTVLRGRVLDSRRQPVPAALIRIQGVTRSGSTTWPADNIDPFSVSDNGGNFVVYGRTAFTAADGAIEASGFATGLFEGWEPGEAIHSLTLTEGAALKGRLLHAGNPVANAEIRLDNFGAESGSTAWNYSAFTDDQGRFLFTNLPANRSFSLYATMESLGDRGACSKQPGQIHGVGSTNDIGDLSLKPAYKLDGRIRLTDGKPVPAHSRLNLLRSSMVGRQDSLTLELGSDGAFSFVGVPTEKVTVYLRIPGYELSPNDRLLKSGSATNFAVANNITGIVIQMQPQSER